MTKKILALIANLWQPWKEQLKFENRDVKGNFKSVNVCCENVTNSDIFGMKTILLHNLSKL